MRKSFKTYLIIWSISLVLFNVVVFIIPSSINGAQIIDVVKVSAAIKGDVTNLDYQLLELADYLLNSADKELILNKYAGAFWPCYICIILSFIGQLFCAYNAFKETNNQKFFYKIPLITISYIGLIITLIAGIFGMFFPDFPIWLAVTICITIFAITLISLLKADLVGNIVSNIDDKVEDKTAFMREMTAKAKALWDADKSNEDLRKLYETFRYVDPTFNKNFEEEKINYLFERIKHNQSEDDIKQLINYLKIGK